MYLWPPDSTLVVGVKAAVSKCISRGDKGGLHFAATLGCLLEMPIAQIGAAFVFATFVVCPGDCCSGYHIQYDIVHFYENSHGTRQQGHNLALVGAVHQQYSIIVFFVRAPLFRDIFLLVGLICFDHLDVLYGSVSTATVLYCLME